MNNNLKITTSLITVLIISVLTTGKAEACGVCTTYMTDYYFPFLKFWIPLFVVWIALANLPRKSMSRMVWVFVIAFVLSLTSPLVPFILFFVWWFWKAIRAALSNEANDSVIPSYWKALNIAFISLTIVFTAYVYMFQFNNPIRMQKFLTYSGGPHPTAVSNVLSQGSKSVPLIMNAMVINGRTEHTKQEGVLLVEKLTNNDFGHDKEKLLQWWNTQKKDY